MRASRDLGLDLATSRIIGDSVSDLAAGKLQGYLWAFLLEPAIVSEMQRRLKCSLMKSSRLISLAIIFCDYSLSFATIRIFHPEKWVRSPFGLFHTVRI